jgi:hypothetical protein
MSLDKCRFVDDNALCLCAEAASLISPHSINSCGSKQQICMICHHEREIPAKMYL